MVRVYIEETNKKINKQIRFPFSSYTCELDQVQSLIEILCVECINDSGGTTSFYASFSESKNPSMKVNHFSDSINSNHNQNQSHHSYNFETDKKSQPDATCEFCDKLFSVNTQCLRLVLV